MKSDSPSNASSRPLCMLLSVLLCGALGATSTLAQPAPLRASEPSAKPMPLPATGTKPAAAMESGKVLETMNAASYTYARVQTPTGEKWIAGPQTTVKVGDTVTWPLGNEMKDFASKTLGRTFDSIAFVGRIAVGTAAAAGAGAAPGAAAGATAGAAPSAAPGTAPDAASEAAAVAAPHAALSGKSAAGPEVKDVAKAEGGMTIAEIYDGRAKLEGKEVAVRGKVVKFNAGIMGRNWIHLQDGSRSAAGDFDLTVTGNGNAAVGDTVVVRGKVVLNKDFGFNYRYETMIEDAKVTVE